MHSGNQDWTDIRGT